MKGMKAQERPWTRYAGVTLLAVLAVASPLFWRTDGRTRNTPHKIGPEAVPPEDVDAVVEESGRTVQAIRSLREMHPGLGLLDAKRLVQLDN